MSRYCPTWLKTTIALLTLAASAPAADTVEWTPRTWLQDAELRDVHFANVHEGWAVGDRGVVWHTVDGGREWTEQRVPARFRLDGVSFADALHGWAVGGQSHAFAPGSRSVVLVTEDGGRNWRQEPVALVSALAGVRAFTTRHAQAWGSRSSIFPSSCYWTADGGRSWNPYAGEVADDLLDAAFAGPQHGAAITRRGQVLRIDDRRTQPSRHPDAGLRGLHDVCLGDALRGVVVGDGALVWLTHDGGATWHAATTIPPRLRTAAIDFRAAAVRGDKIWIAGAPGALILYSPDFGRTWQTLTTGQSLPLNRLCFVDDVHGWAVGALGVILATVDGGRTWHKQRAGGERAAIVGLFADAASTPWELFAQTCGQEGALGFAYCLARRDWLDADAADRDATPRLQAAMASVGGSAAVRDWKFPAQPSAGAPSGEATVAFWNELHAERALDELEFELAKQLRMWRPSTVCTHGAQDHDDPLGYLMNQAVLKAAQHAAEADYRADDFAAIGLAPWKVSKIYGQLPKGSPGGEAVAPTQLAPELGRSLGQQAALARAILGERPTTSTDVLGFQLLMSALPESASGRGFFGGENLPPGGGARRFASPPQDRGGAERLKQLAVRQRNLQAILTRLEDDREAQIVLGQLPELIASLGADSAATLLFDLAVRYQERGRGDFAAQTHGLLVERFPDHALAAPALVWLIQYWSSGEIAWRNQSRRTVAQRAESRAGQVVERAGDVELTAYSSDEIGWGNQELAASHDPEAWRIARASRVQALERLLAKTRPTLAAEPQVIFPASVVARPANANADLGRLQNLVHSRADDAWRRLAGAELSRGGQRATSSPPIWNCLRANQRPTLDGVLDDEVWRHTEELDLAALDDHTVDWPTTLAAAHDEQFLYIAIAAAKSNASGYDDIAATRQHDDDLSRSDRVEIALDIDRDYVTAWRLSVDCRGRVHDDCWGDASWNPKWYVAASQDVHAWYVEAAIPWDQLSPEVPAAEAAWCATARRIAPGVGQQSWASPAIGATSLEHGGWLVFE